MHIKKTSQKFLNRNHVPKAMEYAPFWKRAFAFIFDLLIINLVIGWPFQNTLQGYSMKNIGIDTVFPAKTYFIIIIIFILALLYFTFFEYYIGETPGQTMFNIESISNSGEMTIWKALARNIFILPLFPFYIFWIIEPLHLAFYKQRLLEKWTNTSTIMKSQSLNKKYMQKYNLKKVE
ncbi:MAG: RDD family protein [Candidatus Woesearchaeota archaeon]